MRNHSHKLHTHKIGECPASLPVALRLLARAAWHAGTLSEECRETLDALEGNFYTWVKFEHTKSLEIGGALFHVDSPEEFLSETRVLLENGFVPVTVALWKDPEDGEDYSNEDNLVVWMDFRDELTDEQEPPAVELFRIH